MLTRCIRTFSLPQTLLTLTHMTQLPQRPKKALTPKLINANRLPPSILKGMDKSASTSRSVLECSGPCAGLEIDLADRASFLVRMIEALQERASGQHRIGLLTTTR